MLRRLTAYSLMMVLLLSLIGYYPVLKLARKQFRHEFTEKLAAGLGSSQLCRIELGKTDQAAVEWLEAGEEFSYKGKLYDVVRCDSSGGNYKYFCFEDTEEKDLVSNFTRLMAQDRQDDNGPLRSKTFHWLKVLLSIVYIGDELLQFTLHSISSSDHYSIPSSLSEGYHGVSLRPPAL